MNEIEIFESDLADVDETITLDVPTTWARCFIGIKMVDGSGVPTLGTSGSFAVTAFGPCSDAAQVILGSPITVPALPILSFALNARQVRAVPTSIVGAVQYKIVLMPNKN